MTEANMPPPERPGSRRQEGEQDHLAEDAGMTKRPRGSAVSGEHPQEDAGSSEGSAGQNDRRGLIEKIRDRLTGR